MLSRHCYFGGPVNRDRLVGRQSPYPILIPTLDQTLSITTIVFCGRKKAGGRSRLRVGAFVYFTLF